MSEIYFENKFYFNKKMAQEYSSKILLKSSRFILNSFSLICLVLAIINYYYNYDILIIYFFACSVFFLFSSLFLPFYSSKKMIKNLKILNNNKFPETTVVFDNNNILLTEGNVNIKFSYSQIIKIYNLKYLTILMINQKNGIIIDPSNFTKGDFDSFLNFINKKI